MRGSSRRRSSKINPAGVTTAPSAPPPGRFTDQLVQCVTCGRTFVFTVEEQRQLADAGLPVVAPEQCPRCAPRPASSEVSQRPTPSASPPAPSVERPSVERPPAQVSLRPAPSASPPAPRVERPSVERPPAQVSQPPGRPGWREPTPRVEDEFAGLYTVLSYGHIKAYDETRGVGTVVDDATGHEYRFYHSALEGVNTLAPGQAVEFEVSRKGRDAEASYILPV